MGGFLQKHNGIMISLFNKISSKSYIAFLSLNLLLLTINYPNHLYNNLAIIICFLAVIYCYKELRFRELFSNKIVLAFLCLLLAYIAGLLKTDNFYEAFKVIKLKIPLILTPIFFFYLFKLNSEQQKTRLKINFIYITVAYSIFTLIAVALDIGPVNENILFENQMKYSHSNLTVKLDNHPTYLSYSIMICVLFLLDLKKNYKLNTYIFFSFYFFFAIYILLLLSKISIVLFCILTIYGVFNIFSIKKAILINLVLVIGFLLSIVKTDLNYRFVEEYQSVILSKDLKDKSVPISKKNLRLITTDIFFDQPLNQIITGVGVGDVQDYLDIKYRYYLETKNRTGFKDLNYHNQFFQTVGDCGIIGLLILTYVFILGLKHSITTNNKYYASFLIISILYFLIESFFETQRGIMLFAYFNSFFFFIDKD